MSDAFLALISLSSFSGDSSFSFVWGLFLCFPSLVVALCLCLCIRLICFDSMSCGVALCVRSPVGPSGSDSLISHSGCSRSEFCVCYIDSPTIFGS